MALQFTNDSTDTPTCPICLRVVDKEQYYKLGCNHKIHIECVDLWTKNYSKTCPCCQNWHTKCALCKEKNHSKLTICNDCRIHLGKIKDLFDKIKAKPLVLKPPVSEAETKRVYPDMFSNLSDREIYIQSLRIYALELLDLKRYFDQIDTTHLKSMSDVLQKIHFLLFFRDRKFLRDMYPDILENRWESRYLIHQTKHKSYSQSADNEPMKYIMEEYIKVLFQPAFQSSSEFDKHVRAFEKLQHFMRDYESSLFRKALVSFIETIDKEILAQINGFVQVFEENKVM
ncbi:hypothetical protein AVEN_224692-1 [Araneus ventricosus]|uniref:RING-type domain-containing protein n=1 Tax=Araneus ventricosus TaxID=182803 RepID=A0A4Y2LTI6_ARAVE|nr:hypothetical protein AVEN_224692-1 [Araneus ventricosus]